MLERCKILGGNKVGEGESVWPWICWGSGLNFSGPPWKVTLKQSLEGESALEPLRAHRNSRLAWQEIPVGGE